MNGADLGRNMVEYSVGVAETRVIRITEVDENFFDGD
jgi:restriction endonuclease Mrr